MFYRPKHKALDHRRKRLNRDNSYWNFTTPAPTQALLGAPIPKRRHTGGRPPLRATRSPTPARQGTRPSRQVFANAMLLGMSASFVKMQSKPYSSSRPAISHQHLKSRPYRRRCRCSAPSRPCGRKRLAARRRRAAARPPSAPLRRCRARSRTQAAFMLHTPENARAKSLRSLSP